MTPLASAPRPAPPPGPGGGALGGVSALVTLAAIFVGLVLRGTTRGRPDVTLTVTVVVVYLAGIALSRRAPPTPASRISAPLVFLPALLAPAFVALLETGRAVASPSPWARDELEVNLGVLLFAPILSLIGTAFGTGLGNWMAGAGARAGAALRAAAWAATLATAALLALAATHVFRPRAAQYVASLAVECTMPRYDAAHPEAVGDCRSMQREISGKTCVPWPATKVEEEARTKRPSRLRDLRFDGCEAITVRSDDAHGVTVLQNESGRILTFHNAALTSIYPRHLRGALREPGAFFALAAVGLVAALIALLRPRRSGLPTGNACRDAEAFADGTVQLGGETTRLPLPAGTSLVGPVVAVLDVRAESFREHAGPAVVRVLAGTLAEHRRAERLAPYAFALAFVAVAATPLAVVMVMLG